ncbi:MULTISPECIES: hypothetical protein [Methylomonas]|uniref:hypothetical protein n=1 Tax=Methylomonas TaxID=416 RepID=UPI0012328186|nr:hypothetical protein [Methylomonas rhizoryzae]
MQGFHLAAVFQDVEKHFNLPSAAIPVDQGRRLGPGLYFNIRQQSPFYFDHNADGIKTSTAGEGADDRFLVLDKNGNGTIDNGCELFGNAYLKSNQDKT